MLPFHIRTQLSGKKLPDHEVLSIQHAKEGVNENYPCSAITKYFT